MRINMNKVILVGRLTKDPEMRTTGSGVAVTSFTVAVNRPYSDQSGERQTDFINCVIWRKQAENVARYCNKGSLVAVEGRIQTRSYDHQDGSKRYVTEVVCDNVTFLSSKNSGSTSEPMSFGGNMSEDIATTDVTDDPFKDFGDEIALSEDDLPF
ncbi:MAG: single-stranded DNA-binding protein [Bacilli bacterium]|nr:single-stranded DNA-binding protein [Bacilli bacterium]